MLKKEKIIKNKNKKKIKEITKKKKKQKKNFFDNIIPNQAGIKYPNQKLLLSISR